MYVYKSTVESSGITEQSHWRHKPHSGRGRDGLCFGVSAVVCDSLRQFECAPAFARESERRPFVGEVEKRNEKRFETALQR